MTRSVFRHSNTRPCFVGLFVVFIDLIFVLRNITQFWCPKITSWIWFINYYFICYYWYENYQKIYYIWFG